MPKCAKLAMAIQRSSLPTIKSFPNSSDMKSIIHQPECRVFENPPRGGRTGRGILATFRCRGSPETQLSETKNLDDPCQLLPSLAHRPSRSRDGKEISRRRCKNLVAVHVQIGLISKTPKRRRILISKVQHPRP
jgi:hypothetical protein